MPVKARKLVNLFGLHHFSIKKNLLLLTLLFTTVISGMVLYTVISLNQQKDDGLVINIAGRQRMLAQKLTKEFLLALQQAERQENNYITEEIDKTRRLFDISLQSLIEGGTTYLDSNMNTPVTLPAATDNNEILQLKEVKRLWALQQNAIKQIHPTHYQQQQLVTINQLSLDVLANMNKAVIMMANVADNKVQVMLRNQIWGCVISLLTASILAMLIVQSITKPMHKVVVTTKRIADGDLKYYPFDNHKNNEIGLLTSHVEAMRTSLHNIINLVQQNSRQMAHSAQQVSSVSNEISTTSQLEQENSKEVLEAINVLLETSETVSDHISLTAKTAEQTRHQAQHGIEIAHQGITELNSAVNSVNHTSNQLQELKTFTTQIDDITATIHTIADQTNLLALNAAIEAARAGEQGRGFAVVAEEVRNLATRTSESSKEITDLINKLTEKVEISVLSMQEVVENVHLSQQKSEDTVTSFSTMSEGVSRTTESAGIIAGFNQKQADNLGYLHDKLNKLFEVLIVSSRKASTTSMVAGDLFHISEQLDLQLQGFNTQFTDTTTFNQNEKRKHPRIDNKIRVKLIQDDLIADGLSKDIGMQGLKIRCTEKFDDDNSIEVQLRLPTGEDNNEEDVLSLTAKIIHNHNMDDYYHYGIMFDDLSHNSQVKLKQLFNYFKKPYSYS